MLDLGYAKRRIVDRRRARAHRGLRAGICRKANIGRPEFLGAGKGVIPLLLRRGYVAKPLAVR